RDGLTDHGWRRTQGAILGALGRRSQRRRANLTGRSNNPPKYTTKPSIQTATQNESCKAMVRALALLLEAAPQIGMGPHSIGRRTADTAQCDPPVGRGIAGTGAGCEG